MTAIADPEPSWLSRLDRRVAVIGLAVLVFGFLPLTFLGPGTDLDVYNVLRSGQSIIDGSYDASRPPGAPVFESIVGVLDAVGGTLLVNLGSLAMAAITALAVFRLLDRHGLPFASWYALIVLVNPFVWIAGTSVVDFLWALGLMLVGFNLQLSRRVGPTAVFYALAVGCRLSTVFLVAAALAADFVADDAERADRVFLVKTGAITGLLVGLVFLVPAVTMGWAMFDSAPQSGGIVAQVGRFAVKNFYFFGPVVIVLILGLVPGLVRQGLAVWGRSAPLRFGVFGFIASQALFLSFPWKLAHLIPAFVCLVLVLAASGLMSARWVALLLAAQLVLSVVNVNVAQPDQPDGARSGRLSVEVRTGPLVKDIQCRLDDDRPLKEIWECVVPWSDAL